MHARAVPPGCPLLISLFRCHRLLRRLVLLLAPLSFQPWKLPPHTSITAVTTGGGAATVAAAASAVVTAAAAASATTAAFVG